MRCTHQFVKKIERGMQKIKVGKHSLSVKDFLQKNDANDEFLGYSTKLAEVRLIDTVFSCSKFYSIHPFILISNNVYFPHYLSYTNSNESILMLKTS